MSVMINGNSIAINLDRVSLDANIGNTTHKTQDMEIAILKNCLTRLQVEKLHKKLEIIIM